MKYIALLALFGGAIAQAGPIRVDLSPDNGRKDALTPEWENWLVKDGASISRTFGNVSVSFRAESGIKMAYWKGGADYNVRMANDGVTGTELEMVLSGLSAGRHTITTYHDAVNDEEKNPLGITVDGTAKVQQIVPTKRVTDEYDAAYASFQIDAAAGKDVVIEFRNGDGKNVIVSGFEINGTDRARVATKPFPVHNDEHAEENSALRWTPGPSAVMHNVYLGTDRAAVENATPASPEFKGTQKDATFTPTGLSHFNTYFWRIDELASTDPASATKGEVWRFRTRQLAFPGAEGYGRFARGGRAGRVIEVTNLNDSGPGSLRAACEAEGPRTVVFRVGGTIHLKSRMGIKNPYITIAGQTAPGDGICIRGYSFGCLGSHDVILRYLRVRVGDESGDTLDGMGLASCDHSIVDHCSISWTIDEAFSSRGAKNITFQRNIISEALNHANHKKYVGTGKGHGFAASIGGSIGSFHHNLLAHNAGRNWSLAGGLDQNQRLAGRLDIRNNVVYNWDHRTTDGGCKELNFVNNFYIPGPASRVFTLQKPDPGDPARGMRMYLAGNEMEGRPQVNADNWSAAVMDEQWVNKVRSDTPLFEPHVTTQSVAEAYASVIADVGANLPRQDPVDARIIEDVKQRGARFSGAKSGKPGIIDSQKEAGGFPEYKSAEAPADGDHDGMPDAWEKARGLNPADPADGNKEAVNGFTNLEVYLNELIRIP